MNPKNIHERFKNIRYKGKYGKYNLSNTFFYLLPSWNYSVDYHRHKFNYLRFYQTLIVDSFKKHNPKLIDKVEKVYKEFNDDYIKIITWCSQIAFPDKNEALLNLFEVKKSGCYEYEFLIKIRLGLIKLKE